MTDAPAGIGGNPILLPNSQVFAALDVTGDRDWYQVTVTAGQHYFVSLSADEANGTGVIDAYLEIFGADGTTLITADDDMGAGKNSFIDWVPTESGTYYISAESYDDDVGDYLLSIFENVPKSVATPAALSVNAVVDTATTIVTGYLGHETSFDEDWYAVTLTAGHNYEIDLKGTSEPGHALTNANVKLLDAAGTLLQQLDGKVYFTAQTTGTYYVSVGALNAGDFGYYNLGVTDTDTAPGDPSTTPLGAIDWTSWVVPHAPSATTEIKVFFAEDGAAIHDHLYDSGTATVYDMGSFTALGWTDEQHDAALAVFAQYERVANVHYTVVTDITQADFVMARSNDEGGVAGAGGYWDVGGNSQEPSATFTYDGTDYDVRGFGVFNANQDIYGYDRGDYGFHLLLHELGHGMGLAHPHDTGGGSERMWGVVLPSDFGDHDLNQTINTVMSYNRGWNTQENVPTGGFEASLMAFDIAKLQEKYGAVASATGNDVYTLEGSNSFYSAIWDTGGTDEIVFAGSASAVIDLRPANLQYSSLGGGGLSYVHGVVGGFTIAHGVVVENATGGGGADILVGNDGANRLDGGASADNMAGGDGGDIYVADRADDVVYETNADKATGGDDLVTYMGSADTRYTLSDNVERLTLIGTAATSGAGNGLANTLIGNAAANMLDGGANNDTVTGSGGDDTIVGGAGSDVAIFTHGWAHYAISAAGGAYLLVDTSSSSSDGADVVSSVETFMFAGLSIGAAASVDLAPVIAGNSAAHLKVGATASATGSFLANVTDANAALGDTVRVSQARTDTLGGAFTAVAGAAQIIGQYGTLSLSTGGTYSYALNLSDPDTLALLAGQSAHDVFTFSVSDIKGLAASAQLNVLIDGSDNRAPVITSNGGDTTAALSVAENLSGPVTVVTSTDPDNTLRIYSMSGQDAERFNLDSATGVLTFKAAPNFEAPIDKGANNVFNLVVTASDGSLSDTQAIAVTVRNVAGVSIKGDKASNTIDKSHAFKGRAPGNEEDRIDGKGGKDKLNAAGGNDTLIGGSGADTLTGGTGSDKFVFNAALGTSNVDTVRDFAHNVDLLVLDDKIFGRIGLSLSKKEFYAAADATQAHDANDRIVYNTTTGKLYYDDDGNMIGGNEAVLFATLSKHPVIDAGDFLIA